MRKVTNMFICLALIVFALPVCFFNEKQTVSTTENRNLAAKPHLLAQNNINHALFSEYDAYFADHLGFRNQLIRLQYALNPYFKTASLLVSKDYPRVIEGKNDWYFYLGDGNVFDFAKKNLFTEEKQACFQSNVAAIAAWCEKQNIPCIFLICPNKHSIYPEFYLSDRPAGLTRADQLCAIFEKCGVQYIFPRDELLTQKAHYDVPLYHECGTHWNQLGAYIAATVLKSKISECLPDALFPHISYSVTDSYPSTDDSMLGLVGLDIDSKKSTRVVVEPDGHTNADFYTYLKNSGDAGADGVHTVGTDKNLPRALIFRDSFFVGLELYISPLFSEAEYIWKQFREEDKEYILQYKPDILIFESVERYAPTMCGEL